MTTSRPKLATNSLNTCAPPARPPATRARAGAASRGPPPPPPPPPRGPRGGPPRPPPRRARAGWRPPRRHPRRDARLDLVGPPPKDGQPLLVAAPRGRRIVETPVQPRARGRERRTGLVGAVAHGDHVVPPLTEKAIERLRGVPAQVDADLRHRGHRERVDAARLGAGARHLESIAGQAAKQPLRHLAAGGIVGAEKEHARDTHPRRLGFVARTNALMNLPSTWGATASASTPLSARNWRASSAR